eukprot:6190167-Pleurochrysis_carterae.AAC.1
MNLVNRYKSRSQRANVDFKPLIDHYTAMEYSTKYATMFEKARGVFERLVADAFDRCKDVPGETASKIAFAKFLVQQTSARNWSSQEVAHVNQGVRTVNQSHSFEEINLCSKVKVLRTNLKETS